MDDHDTMTITDTSYDLFQSKLDQLENFGVIGFNIIASIEYFQ